MTWDGRIVVLVIDTGNWHILVGSGGHASEEDRDGGGGLGRTEKVPAAGTGVVDGGERVTTSASKEYRAAAILFVLNNSFKSQFHTCVLNLQVEVLEMMCVHL